VGCHLVLVGGRSVAPPEQVLSLVDDGGLLPQTLPKFVAKVSAGLIRPRHIERELRAQIEKIRGAGIKPSHLDTHKHTHAHPRVMRALAHVARDMGISRIRNPFESIRDAWTTTRSDGGNSAQLLAAAAAQISAPSFANISRKYGLQSPEHFLGVAMTGQMTTAVVRRMIDTLPEGTTEMMFHPGIYGADLIASGSRLQKQRQTELETLLDPELKHLFVKQGIRLISYRELN
jgi:chitin disaccharide deacetylase